MVKANIETVNKSVKSRSSDVSVLLFQTIEKTAGKQKRVKNNKININNSGKKNTKCVCENGIESSVSPDHISVMKIIKFFSQRATQIFCESRFDTV